MKLPDKIVGRNKIRDLAICKRFEELLDDPQYPTIESVKKQVALQFNFSEIYIYKIVRRNNAYIPIDKEWEKRKRINRLKVEIKNKEKSTKDVADLMEQLRKEIEGDKPLIDMSTNYTNRVEIVVDDGKYIKTPITLEPVESVSFGSTIPGSGDRKKIRENDISGN